MPLLLKEYSATKSIFGVCLGMQAIGEAFASPLKNLPTVFHGMATPVILLEEDILFQHIPKKFKVGRYHSWVIDENKINTDLIITSKDENGLIMSVKHKNYDVRGVQFHPESILSEYGETILKNWLSPYNT
jgi:anthranilate synthase component 2